ncbi:MAG TPA: hypothetical protein VEZ51_00515 [Gemmatimonadaceae bacterium]|nr:hypothetical protein [Gemmatimonadaceae bacterium]
MAGFKGRDRCNEILDFNLGNGTPATLYIALFTSAPSATGGGTEVTGGSYARVAKTNNATNFPAASGSSKSSGTDFDFGTASADWGIVTWAAVVETASGALGAGDIVYAGPLTTPRTVLNGDSFKIPSAGAVFTEA